MQNPVGVGNAPNKNGSPPSIASSGSSLCGVTPIEGIPIPFVQRGVHAFLPVRILHRQFLSKYMNDYKGEIRNPLPSYYMTQDEATALTCLTLDAAFNTTDLLVNLDQFLAFYKYVKKICKKDGSGIEGGWVQINNTVVPYVVKDDSKMIALSIVRCAAGLLIGRDVPAVYPTVAECAYLNDSCSRAGISFEFTETTELVELVLLECMCEQRPFIKLLPAGNPFSVAQFRETDEILRNDEPSTFVDADDHLNAPSSNLQITGESGYLQQNNQKTDTILNRPGNLQISEPSSIKMAQPVAEYNISRGLEETIHRNFDPQFKTAILNQPELVQYLSRLNEPTNPSPVVPATIGTIQSFNNYQLQCTAGIDPRQIVAHMSNALSHTLPSAPPFAPPCTRGLELLKLLCDDQDVAPSQNGTNCSSNVITNARKRSQSLTDEEKQQQMLHVQSPIPTTVSAHEDIRAEETLTLQRVHCFGKTISCMVKDTELYILLEAMNRLYFPFKDLPSVISVVQSLGVPMKQLTREEERDFMKFYKLPADKLKSNKIINVKDFMRIYSHIYVLLNSSWSSSTTNAQLANQESASFPNCSAMHAPIIAAAENPVTLYSNLVFNHSLCTQSSAMEVNPPRKDTPQREIVAESYAFTKMTKQAPLQPTVGSSQPVSGEKTETRPSKRRRRVIGEIICIDD